LSSGNSLAVGFALLTSVKEIAGGQIALAPACPIGRASNPPIMKRTWIKFIYERNTYVVDLSRISAFACSENGRLRFWLPDGKVAIVLHPRSNPEAHQKILDYVEETTGQALCQTFRRLQGNSGKLKVKEAQDFDYLA
jgi:hypothetical protein